MRVSSARLALCFSSSSCSVSPCADPHDSTTATTTATTTTTYAHCRHLIVVRHGETEWNRELRVQGVMDVRLNAKGRLQAAACTKALLQQQICNNSDNSNKSISSSSSSSVMTIPWKIYTSPMTRASDTAQVIADAFNTTNTSAAATTTTVVSPQDALSEWFWVSSKD